MLTLGFPLILALRNTGLLTICWGLACVKAWAQSSEVEWGKILRGSRSEHNFTLSLGLAGHSWRGRNPARNLPYEFNSQAYLVDLAYAYHLPLSYGFGYVLGTSTGLIFPESSKQGFKTNLTYHLPGIEGGIVWDLSSSFRVIWIGCYGWQRVEQLKLPAEYQSSDVAVTGDLYSTRFAIDYFHELSWAVRIEYETGQLKYRQNEGLNLEKTLTAWRIGMVKHAL